MSDNQVIEFLKKYENNPAAFTKAFTNIWYDHDGTPQEIYPKQLKFLNSLNLPDVRVVLKCRQSGFSSSIVAKVVHNAYFKKSPEILIVSKSMKQAQKTLDRIRKAFNSMPDAIRPEFIKETQEELKLANGVTIYSLSPVPDNCRGFTGDVYLDEMGAFGHEIGRQLWEAIAPSTTKGFSITVVGTPKGKNNLFYDLCTKSASQIAEQELPFDNWRLKVHWSDVPHIAKEVDKHRAKYTSLMWAQEFELEFLDDSEELYFGGDFIRSNCHNEEASKFGLINIPYKKYRETEITAEQIEEYRYLYDTFSEIFVGWDMAKIQDQSIVSVFGRRKDNIDALQLIDIHKLGGDYHYQSVCVSIIAQLLSARKVGFDNTGLGQAVKDHLDKTKIAGKCVPVNFNNKTKIPMYANMRTMMSQGKIMLPDTEDLSDDLIIEYGWPEISKEIFKQLISLEYNPIAQRIQAKPGEHDDIPSSFLCAVEASKNKKLKSGFMFIGTGRQ